MCTQSPSKKINPRNEPRAFRTRLLDITTLSRAYAFLVEHVSSDKLTFAFEEKDRPRDNRTSSTHIKTRNQVSEDLRTNFDC